MLKEDYIMRLFQQFNEMLAKWLNKKKFDNVELVVSFNDELVKPYLEKDFAFFEKQTIGEIIDYFQNVYPNETERIARLEILAELFYQRSMLEPENKNQKTWLNKSLELFLHVNSIDKTFSMVREGRIEEIRKAP